MCFSVNKIKLLFIYMFLRILCREELRVAIMIIIFLGLLQSWDAYFRYGEFASPSQLAPHAQPSSSIDTYKQSQEFYHVQSLIRSYQVGSRPKTFEVFSKSVLIQKF